MRSDSGKGAARRRLNSQQSIYVFAYDNISVPKTSHWRDALIKGVRRAAGTGGGPSAVVNTANIYITKEWQRIACNHLETIKYIVAPSKSDGIAKRDLSRSTYANICELFCIRSTVRRVAIHHCCDLAARFGRSSISLHSATPSPRSASPPRGPAIILFISAVAFQEQKD